MENHNETLERTTKELEALTAIDRALASNNALHEILMKIMGVALDVTGANHANILLVDDATGDLVLQATTSGPETLGQRYKPGESIVGLVVQHKAAVTIADLTEEPWANKYAKQRDKLARAELAVPLLFRNKLIGVINLESLEASAFDEDDQRLLEALATQAALSIERAMIQTELEEARKRQIAAETFAALGDIAGSIVHRLANIAGGTRTDIQLIQHLLEKPNKKAIEKTRSILERMERDTIDSFEVVNLLGERFRLPKQALYDVNALIHEALERTTLPAEVTLVTKLDEKLPSLFIDRRFVDVCIELVTNALKAMSNKGELAIETKLSENGRWIEVLVSDTGCGVALEQTGRLFELGNTFWKNQSIQARSGMGFGLWWIKTFLQRQGGEIVLARSELAKGSTFVVQLPVQPEEKTDA